MPILVHTEQGQMSAPSSNIPGIPAECFRRIPAGMKVTCAQDVLQLQSAHLLWALAALHAVQASHLMLGGRRRVAVAADRRWQPELHWRMPAFQRHRMLAEKAAA